MQTRINLFVVNTPFQYSICLRLIELNFNDEQNIILTTLKINEINETRTTKTIYIRRNLFVILDFIRFKKLIDKYLKNNQLKNVFFPHLNNLFSSFLYNKTKNNTGIITNCYYEGVAQFYDPEIKISKLQYTKRKIISLFAGQKYIHYSKLFPDEFRNIAVAYSPIVKYTSRFKKIIKFDLDKIQLVETNIKKISIILVGKPLKHSIDFRDTLKQLKNILKNSNLCNAEEIYFKPHYESKKKYIRALSEELNSLIENISILDKNLTLEYICGNLQKIKIISLGKTSALINLSLIHPTIDLNIDCNFDSNLFLDKILKELNIKFINE